MNERYRVVGESLSGQCWFYATVVDTAKGVSICECFEVEDARLIAAALNAAN